MMDDGSDARGCGMWMDGNVDGWDGTFDGFGLLTMVPLIDDAESHQRAAEGGTLDW